LLSLVSWAGLQWYGNIRASALVDALATASLSEVPALIQKLSHYQRWANPRLSSIVQSAGDGTREKLHASLALVSVDPSQLPFLESRLLEAQASELTVLRGCLAPHRAKLTAKLWNTLEASRPGDARFLPAAAALALYDPQSANWTPS